MHNIRHHHSHWRSAPPITRHRQQAPTHHSGARLPEARGGPGPVPHITSGQTSTPFINAMNTLQDARAVHVTHSPPNPIPCVLVSRWQTPVVS